MIEKTAIQFYKNIEKEKDKYKLVNGLFIVQYLDSEISFYIGDFLKKNSALNETSINKVIINPNTSLKYNKKKNMATTSLGFWKPLGIKFIETSIKDILK